MKIWNKGLNQQNGEVLNYLDKEDSEGQQNAYKHY